MLPPLRTWMGWEPTNSSNSSESRWPCRETSWHIQAPGRHSACRSRRRKLSVSVNLGPVPGQYMTLHLAPFALHRVANVPGQVPSPEANRGSLPCGKPVPVVTGVHNTARYACLALLRHWMRLARSLALAMAGSRIEARIAMIAMTTKSSINVKPAPSQATRLRQASRNTGAREGGRRLEAVFMARYSYSSCLLKQCHRKAGEASPTLLLATILLHQHPTRNVLDRYFSNRKNCATPAIGTVTL